MLGVCQTQDSYLWEKDTEPQDSTPVKFGNHF